MLDDIVEVLHTVIERERAARLSYAGLATDVYNLASRRYMPMSEPHLDRIARTRTRCDWTVSGPHLFLPRTTEGKTSIPVSGLCIDLTDDQKPELRFRVAFFAANDLVPKPRELHGVGFRFETPEGPGAGMHGYYHAQLFTHFAKNVSETQLENCPEWLPVQQPAFPLNAGDPLGLLAIMLVSIYGQTRVQAEYGAPLVARIPAAASPASSPGGSGARQPARGAQRRHG